MSEGYDFGFKVCRVCLSPDEVTKLTSIAGDGSIGQKFQEFSGVNISLDRQEDVLICDQCSAEVIKVFDLRESIRDFDELYFEPKRHEENENIEGSVNEVSQGHLKGLRATAKKNYKNINSESESKRLPMKKTERNAHRSKPDLKLQDKAQQKKSVKAINDITKKEGAGSSKVYVENHGPEKFQCTICENWFVYRWNLKEHQLRVHQGLKRFHCDLCSRSFFSKSEIRHHIEASHLKHNLRFECTFAGCTKFFKTKQCLRQHKSCVHKIEETTCETCGKVYLNKKKTVKSQARSSSQTK